jgi:hypothetical protein
MTRRIARAVLLAVASVAVALALLEGAVRGLGLFAAARAALTSERAAPATAPRPAVQNQVNPFLGWNLRPGRPSPLLFWSGAIPLGPRERLDELGLPGIRSNALGYLSPIADYTAVGRDRFVIGIFGGSVADDLALLGAGALRDALRARRPELGDSIVVLNLGSGGYKQPQQAISLLETLALGVPFDAVVNVDGFNEVVFGAADAAAGHHPLLPSRRHWALTVELASTLPTGAQLELAAAVARERRRAGEIAAAASSGPAAHSALVAALAGALVQRHRDRAARLEDELQEQAEGETASPLPSLPDPCLARGDGCLERIGQLWANASLSMDALARGAGASYLHVLQPNQYVEDSKPLSAEERAYAVKPTRQAGWVRRGYPVLQERGAALRALGVDFQDETGLFRDHPETLYRDLCCHYNLAGNEILAEAIAQRIADQLAERKRGGPDR